MKLQSRRTPSGHQMSSGVGACVCRFALLVAHLVAFLSVISGKSNAQVFEDPGFTSELVTILPPNTTVGVTWASDGRMFIWQKNGIVRIFRNGQLLSQPFLDMSAQINRHNDNGMLGLAVDPNFGSNGYVYLSYVFEDTGNPNDDNPKSARLVRVQADPGDLDVMLPGSEAVLMDGLPNSVGAHTAGTIRFAPDGTLFFGNGDGADPSFADLESIKAQDITSPRGKIFRLNPDGSAPTNNPYYDGTNSVRSKVWCYGMRNPYRFSLHPTTGELYVADVGWSSWEEFDRCERGKNYGWPYYEAGLVTEYSLYMAEPDPADLVFPLHKYSHTTGDLGQYGTCLVGGDFYRGTEYPEAYRGNYFYSDYSGNWIHRMVLDSNGGFVSAQPFATGLDGPACIEQGPDGLFYVVNLNSGEIRRIRYNSVSAVASATPRSGYSPLQVNFSSAGSIDNGGGSLTYLWDFGDGNTSTEANPTHTYISGGLAQYTVLLAVSNSGGQVGTASLGVTVGSVPPVVSISAPANASGYFPGQSVNFAGSASDAEDGQLPASALQWTVLLHHDTHVHVVHTGIGTGGSFKLENHGSLGTFFYEVVLSATDSSGLTASNSVNVSILPDNEGPSPPGELIATPAAGQIILNWLPASDNGRVGEYRVERRDTESGPFVQIRALTGIALSDGGLTPGVTYTYRVRAVDVTGNPGDYSNLATAEPSTTALHTLFVSGINTPLGNTPWQTEMAVRFTGEVDFIAAKAGVWLRKVGNPTFNIRARLWESSGANVGVLIDSSESIPAATLDERYSEVLFPGTLSVPISIGADYWISIECDGVDDAANHIEWQSGGDPVAEVYYDADANDQFSMWDYGLSSFTLYPGDSGGANNTPPTISTVPPQFIDEDHLTEALPFLVGDFETNLAQLSVTGSSSNPSLVSNANISFGGSGGNRTVSLTPAADQTGVTTITLIVSDGVLSTTTSFVLTVNPVNDSPTISLIPNQTIAENGSTGLLAFSVDDREAEAVSLTVTGTSSNQLLVPDGNITFEGTGANRSVTVVPAPDQSGITTISVIVSDGALSAMRTFLLNVGSSTGTTVFPLKVSANRRYLVDQLNRPFLVTGDSPQALITNVTLAEVDTFLRNRASHGFNTVWINLLCETYTGGPVDGSLVDGTRPFTANVPSRPYYDLSTPNEAYFARVDAVINLAAQHNILVMLNPIEAAGWGNTLDANFPERARSYGRYIGNRYKNFDNILWAHGNDHQSWENYFSDLIIREVPSGVREMDNRHLNTVLLSYPVSSSMDSEYWTPLIELNSTYSYYPTYAQCLIDYNRANFMPAFMAEANYEYEKDYSTTWTLRRQAYWALLSGSCGQMYGNYYTWQMVPGWQSHMDTPGSYQIGYLRKFFEMRKWYELVPDQIHSVVTAGYGTFADSGSVNNSDYATAARTPDGRLVLVYMPTIRPVTVEMSKLSAPAFARWFDPSNGNYTSISPTLLANSGMRTFTPPGDNSDGEGDWVLVLETQLPDIDIPQVTLSVSGDQVVIVFPTVPGQTYELQSTQNLTNESWQPIFGNVSGTGGALQFIDPTPISDVERFYRVKASR